MRIEITIPGKLDAALNPNARLHWRRVHEAKAAAKLSAYAETRNASLRTDTTGIEHATFHIELGKAKGQKHHDQDNLAASCKAILDGIALALGVDDRHWQIGTVRQVRDSERTGYVKITLEWQQDAKGEAA